MARTKIAPGLRWFFLGKKRPTRLLLLEAARMQTELRALLAVARAARPVARAMNLCAPVSVKDMERLRLADARLDRLNRRKP